MSTVRTDDLANRIIGFLQKTGWYYEYRKRDNYIYAIAGTDGRAADAGGRAPRLEYVICPANTVYNVYTLCPLRARNPEETDRMAEFVCRANHSYPFGNLELDHRDGEIRFRTCVVFEQPEDVSDRMIIDSFRNATDFFRCYGDALYQTLLGSTTPEKAAAAGSLIYQQMLHESGAPDLTRRKETAERITDSLKQNNWKYEYREQENEIISYATTEGRFQRLIYRIEIRDAVYNIYALCPLKARTPIEKADLAEFLCRANYGFRFGNYEMDFDTGEISYRACVPFENISDIRPAVMTESFRAASAFFIRYEEGLLRVLLGAMDPSAAVTLCEQAPPSPAQMPEADKNTADDESREANEKEEERDTDRDTEEEEQAQGQDNKEAGEEYAQMPINLLTADLLQFLREQQQDPENGQPSSSEEGRDPESFDF